jgi:sporulation protein YlmC with PRC-barrel domain
MVPKLVTNLTPADLQAAPDFEDAADARKDFVNYETELDGSEVFLKSGETLGTVEDLLLERATGAVLGAIVQIDEPGIDIGQAGAPRFFPWAAVQNAPGQDEGLVLALSPQEVEAAPFFGSLAPEGGVPPQQ